MPTARKVRPLSDDAISQALDRTESYLRSVNYRGWDPYDGLMSPIFRLPPFTASARLRFVAQQVIRRLPFQMRPILRIPRGYNPVTAGLVLQAFVNRDAATTTAGPTRAGDCDSLLADLVRLRSPGYDHACWGYDFFWQSQFATNPPYHPTIVATGFVTNALFEYWQWSRDERAADLLRSAVGFFEKDLNRVDFGDSFSWSYSPTDHRAVVNATLKGARFCAQSFALTGEARLADLAAATVRFAIANQRPDGSWPYAVNDPRGWADNFHTGYVLDCLDEYRIHTGDGSYDREIARGFDYYAGHFFAAGCIPKYYDNRTYPIDATACAQSILTLVRFGDIDLADRVCRWCLNHMALPDGSFAYQRHRHFVNRLAYVRWSVAWMFLAMSRLEREVRGPGADSTGARTSR